MIDNSYFKIGLFIIMLIICSVCAAAEYNYNEYDYSNSSYAETVSYLSWSLNRFQEDLFPLNNFMSTIESRIENRSVDTVSKEELNSAIEDINASYKRLYDALNFTEMKIYEMNVPVSAEAKRNAALLEFQSSKHLLEEALDDILAKSSSLNYTFSLSGYANETLTEIDNTRTSMKAVLDVIYNESTIESIESYFDTVSHRQLFLNYTKTPRVMINVTSAAPGSDDLAETIDIQFSEEILNRSNNLTVPELYGFVKEGIKYRPYYGLLKGSEITYQQRIGNDLDQASLLIALLRSKGIHSRYVLGTVEMDMDNALLWMDAKNESTLMNIFKSNGISAQHVGDKVMLEHWWITAYVNGSWVDMDPSFNIIPRDAIEAALIGNLSTYVMTDEEMEDLINDLNKTQEQILAEEFTEPDLSGYTSLPASLDYTLISRIAEYNNLPIEEIHYININLYYGNDSLFEYRAPVLNISPSIITLNFSPTTASESIIAVLGNDTPTFLIEHISSLMIDGREVVNSSTPIPAGRGLSLVMEFETPRQNTTETATIASGFDHVIVIDPGRISLNYLDGKGRKFVEKFDSMAYDEKVIQVLYLTGLTYFVQSDLAYDDQADMNLVNWFRPEAGAVVVASGSVRRLGTSLDLVPNVGLDNVRDVLSVNIKPEQNTDVMLFRFMILTGGLASAYEAEVINYVTGIEDVVSYTDLKNIAYFSDIGLRFAYNSSLNYSQRSQANLPNSILDQISHYSKNGFIVQYIPTSLRLNENAYFGYLIIDPQTGGTSSIVYSTQLKHGSEGDVLGLGVIEKVVESISEGRNAKSVKDYASFGRYVGQMMDRSADLAWAVKHGSDLNEVVRPHFGKLNGWMSHVAHFKKAVGFTDKALKAIEDIEKTYKFAECVAHSSESYGAYGCYAWYVSVTFGARTYDIAISDKVALSSVPGFFADLAIKKLGFPILEGAGGEFCDPRYDIKTKIDDAKKENGKCEFTLGYTISNVGVFPQKETTYSSNGINPSLAGKFTWLDLKANDQKYGPNEGEFTMSLDDKKFKIIAEETDLQCHIGFTTPKKKEHEVKNPCIERGMTGYEPAIAVDEFGNVHAVYITGDHDILNYVVFGTIIEEAEELFILGPEYKSYLKPGEVGKELSDAFWDNGLYLSTSAQISQVKNNWEIEDDEWTYIIKETSRGLEVYELEELVIGEPSIKKTLIDLGNLSGDLTYPDIILDEYHNAHVTVNYISHVPYPTPGGENFAFIMDWVAYRKISPEGEVLVGDVLEGWPGGTVITDPLVLGLGYGYMFDIQVLDSRIGLIENNKPVITSSVRVFYPSQWYIFTSQIRSLAYGAMFGGLVGGTAWIAELGYTITHISYWDTLRTATYDPGGGTSPDENWVWETVASHSYSMDPTLGEDSFWAIGSNLKRFRKPSSLNGEDITYLEEENGNYRLLSTFAGEISQSVDNWYSGLDYDSNGEIHMTWRSGAAVYYKNFTSGGSNTSIVVAISASNAKPQITVGPNNWLYIAWIDSKGGLSYSKSEDGTNWTEPEQVVSKIIKNFDINAGIEPGSVYVIYEDENRDITIQPIDRELQKTTIAVKCPVNLHLYRGKKHTGLLPNGTFEKQIEGIEYSHDTETNLKQLIIEGDTQGIEFLMEAYDSGHVNISVSRTATEDGYGKTYYRDVLIANCTNASFYLNDNNLDYPLEVDFDCDGIVDYSIHPNYMPYIKINPLSAYTYNATDVILLNATAFDAEDGVLNGSLVTWNSNVTGFLGIGNPITTANLLYGEHLITAAATDIEGESSNDSISIFVDDPVAPTITIYSPQNNTTFNTNVVNLNYAVNEPIRSARANFSNGQAEELSTDTFSYNIALLNVLNGTYSLKLTVEDLAGNSASASASFNLAIDNYAPVLNYISLVEVFRGELVDINATGYDLDNDQLTFTYGSPLDSEGKWQTTLNDTGIYFSNVSVSDGELTDLQIVSIEVKDRPPIFDPIENIKVPSYGISIEFDMHAVDPEGEEVTYFMDALEGANLTGNHFSWTPTRFQVRNHLITFYASDGVVNGTTTLIIAVGDANIMCSFDYECGNTTFLNYCQGKSRYRKGTVRTCKNAGTLNAYCDSKAVDEFVKECPYECVRGACTGIPAVDVINDIMVNETDTIVIVVNASDPDGDPLTYSINNPKFSQSSNTFTWNTSFDDAGRHLIIITVSDGFNDVKRQFNIIVKNVNRAPVAPLIPTLNLTQGVYFSYYINGTDPDSDALLYELNPPRFPLNRYTGQLTINPRNSDSGTHYLQVRISDAEYTVNSSFILVVDDVNDAPRVMFIPPQVAAVNIPFSYQVDAMDPDNDILIYSDNTTLFDIDSNGLIQFTPAQSDIGTHWIDILASDGNLTTSQLMNLIVTDKAASTSVLDEFHDLNVTEGDFIDLWESIGGGG